MQIRLDFGRPEKTSERRRRRSFIYVIVFLFCRRRTTEKIVFSHTVISHRKVCFALFSSHVQNLHETNAYTRPVLRNNWLCPGRSPINCHRARIAAAVPPIAIMRAGAAKRWKQSEHRRSAFKSLVRYAIIIIIYKLYIHITNIVTFQFILHNCVVCLL